MVIILDQNTCAEAVKKLATDDKSTGIPAGSYVVDPVVYEQIQEFLHKLAKAS